MRVITSLVALGLASCAPARESTSFIPTNVTASRFADVSRGEAAEAGAAAGVDYGALLRRAAHDKRALQRFVRLSVNRHFDGAALEIHLYYIRELLVWWGDQPFSLALSGITHEERRILRHGLMRRELARRGFSSTARLLYASNET
jgi:hypothetical protein